MEPFMACGGESPRRVAIRPGWRRRNSLPPGNAWCL